MRYTFDEFTYRRSSVDIPLACVLHTVIFDERSEAEFGCDPSSTGWNPNSRRDILLTRPPRLRQWLSGLVP